MVLAIHSRDFPSTHHMVFSDFPMFSHDFLMKTSIDIRLPMIFPCFSHDFPMIFPFLLRISQEFPTCACASVEACARCMAVCAKRCAASCSVAQVMDDHCQNIKIKCISPTINDYIVIYCHDHYIPLYTITND